MPKLENSENHFYIDGQRYSRNSLNYLLTSSDKVVIYYAQQPERIITQGVFNQWTDTSSTPYTSISKLLADLNKFMFTYEPILQSVERGNDYFLKVKDQQSNTLLTDMLMELREMNIHLSLITGQKIKERKR